MGLAALLALAVVFVWPPVDLGFASPVITGRKQERMATTRTSNRTTSIRHLSVTSMPTVRLQQSAVA